MYFLCKTIQILMVTINGSTILSEMQSQTKYIHLESPISYLQCYGQKKKYSFFKNGMQPVLFSLEKARRSGNGWSRAGFNIRYYQSNFIETDSGPYYTLQFQISFEFQNDYVTLSPYPSYSYSRLMNLIKKCSLAARYHEIYFKLSSVLKSLGGN